MGNYRVVELIDKKKPEDKLNDYYEYAFELIYKYDGLKAHYTMDEIIMLWREHSEEMCASWLQDTAEDVEEVFGVKLEEIK